MFKSVRKKSPVQVTQLNDAVVPANIAEPKFHERKIMERHAAALREYRRARWEMGREVMQQARLAG